MTRLSLLRLFLPIGVFLVTTHPLPAPVTVLPEATPSPKEATKPKPKEAVKPKPAEPAELSGTWVSNYVDNTGLTSLSIRWTLNLENGKRGYWECQKHEAFHRPGEWINGKRSVWIAPQARSLVNSSAPYSITLRNPVVGSRRDGKRVMVQIGPMELRDWAPNSVTREEWMERFHKENIFLGNGNLEFALVGANDLEAVRMESVPTLRKVNSGR